MTGSAGRSSSVPEPDALRWGLSGFFVDCDTGEAVGIRTSLRELIDQIEPALERLGDTDYLPHARTLLAGTPARTGSETQRARQTSSSSSGG